MKRYFLLTAILLAALCSSGQSVEDQAAVVQKCLDLPELQSYYPKAADGTFCKVYIMQYPYAFPAGMEVSKFGRFVPLADRKVIMKENAQAYFLFQSFVIEGNKARVACDFLYNFASSGTWVSVTLVLQKEGSTWNVTGSNLIRK